MVPVACKRSTFGNVLSGSDIQERHEVELPTRLYPFGLTVALTGTTHRLSYGLPIFGSTKITLTRQWTGASLWKCSCHRPPLAAPAGPPMRKLRPARKVDFVGSSPMAAARRDLARIFYQSASPRRGSRTDEFFGGGLPHRRTFATQAASASGSSGASTSLGDFGARDVMLRG